MQGYLDNKKETENLIYVDKYNGERWARTGYIGYIDEDGFLFIEGRTRRVFFAGPEGTAYKIYPNIIEDLLYQDANSKEVVCISYRSERILKIAVFLTLNQTEKREIMIERLEKLTIELPKYMRPSRYMIIDKLPVTDIEKIDYKKLEDMINQ